MDLYPERRGMASSLQSFIASLANAIVAGAISPLVMHSAVALAATSICMMGIGLVAWMYMRKRWPAIGNEVYKA
jgi:DHA1 family bicyclomycin/chloramphenicol resistance-like MFS transporter